ncbi:hypothetical protein Tco_1127298 [Tanacetum coccineum]
MDFAKPVKAIALPQDVLSTSNRRLIELENQVQRLMEAYLAPTQPTLVNKITTSCEICSGPHDTQASQDTRLSKFEADFKQQQSKMTNKIDTVLKAITDQIAGTLPSDMVKNPKLGTHPVLSARSYPTMDLQCSTQIHSPINTITIHPKQQILKFNSLFESLGLVPLSANAELVCTKEGDGDVMFLEIIPKDDNFHKEEPEAGVQEIMRRKLGPRENPNGGISNFTGRIKGMHVFVGNFTYVVDFMIVEDISWIIDPRLSHIVLGRPFIEISNMTHDPPEGVVRFTYKKNEVSYRIPHKIEQYNSLSNLEKEHTKSVYIRNEEDKRRGVEYVMSRILGFYKECLELGPEYVTGIVTWKWT